MKVTHETVVATADDGTSDVGSDEWNADHALVGDDPIFDKFGAPDTAFEFETSSLTGLTGLSTTPDVLDADTTIPNALYIQDNATGVSLVGRYASVSSPFTAICKILDTNHKGSFNRAGMFVGVATPGKMFMPGLLQVSAERRISNLSLANPTDSGASDIDSAVVINIEAPIYLAIRVNSTTSVDYAFSYNGYVWTLIRAAHNPSMTVGSIGLGVLALNATPFAAVFDFLRIWNSALTLPGL